MSEIGPNDVVHFVASIPPSSSAIKFDGEAAGGGTLTLLVPGTDENGLQQMLLLRGRRFLVTAAVMQTELPLQPVMPENQETLFPAAPALQPSLHEQAAAIINEDGSGSATGVNAVSTARGLPEHVHTFGVDGRCLATGCDYRRTPVFGDAGEIEYAGGTVRRVRDVVDNAMSGITPKARRVRRGSLTKGSTRKKAKA